MTATVHGMSVRQPYAYAIADLGMTVVTRAFSTGYRGAIAICAPAAWSERGCHDPRVRCGHFARTGECVETMQRAERRDRLSPSTVVAVADLADVHPVGPKDTCCQPWGERLVYDIEGRPGRYRPHHWCLENVKALDWPSSVVCESGPTWPLSPQLSWLVLNDPGAEVSP